ncbi:HAD family hydrolase [Edaphobacillus lindanitolerans]|uniref:Phosphoserine phosphatase n=1 Tax=Edaphobacillus lindanitolerans TaxID=550447 RepID=A0A1U7PNN6_9BACI|nr:HAD family hydrolase [Edaphobacillus lindanitolerans]SIT93044.1 putative hydrolase of the HAD superfamily [Edaphobacillus lindanitolerans]
MIRTIIFDLDDTLIWDKKSIGTAFDRTCRYAADKAAVDAAALELAVREAARALYSSYDTYDFTQMIGINPFEGLWGSFDDPGEEFGRMKEIVPAYRREAWTNGLRALGVDDPALGGELAGRFIEERRNAPFIYEETFDVLDRLREDYQLVLLTNGAPSLQREKLAITPELEPYFDRVVISGAFGRGKPDESIFRHVLEETGTGASEALMVGDNLMTDILGAGRAGIRSVWINREGKKRLPDVTPDYEISRLDQIETILKEMR